MKCDSCKLNEKTHQKKQKTKTKTKTKHWYARVFAKDNPSQNKFYMLLFNSYIVKLFNTQHKRLLPSATEDDITDVILDPKNIRLKQNIDGAVIDIIA